MSQVRCTILTLALAAVVFPGCGEGRPDTAPVSGRVLLNGEPVPDASVTFIPEGGRSANGVTDAQGQFQLTTFQEGDGAILGEHTVTVTPLAGDVPEEIPDDYSYTDSGQNGSGKNNGSGQAGGPSPIPSRYADPATSNLTFTVEAGGKNEFDVELTE